MNIAEQVLIDKIPSSVNGSRIGKQKALDVMKIIAWEAYKYAKQLSADTEMSEFFLAWYENRDKISQVEQVLKDNNMIYGAVAVPPLPDNTVTMPRYFVDLRCGCAAVRDRWHETFDVEYYGLNVDVPDVVKYVSGVNNLSWEVKQKDIDMLNELCDKLNEINNKIHN